MSEFALKTYQLILNFAVELLDIFPPKRIEKEEFAMRKGMLRVPYEPPQEGSIWVHGASLGEVITLRPFLKKLCERYGRNSIVCTTMTTDGLNQLLKDEDCGLATLLPIGLPSILVPFIEKIKPRVLLISETEIWPLTLDTLAKHNVPYGIVNCRINEKSVKMMRLAWCLFESAIKNLSFVFPQEKHYMRRLQILGVPKEKQKQLGCFKYDITDPVPDTSDVFYKFKIPSDKPVICFGSTHPGEETQILDALSPIINDLIATIVIAPRHIKRAHEVEKLLNDRGIAFNRASENITETKKFLLVDTMGELRKLYAISSIAFVGGSLINRGGHNLMEPAAFAKPVISGPNTFNFRYEMMAMKKNNAIVVVRNSEDLRNAILDWQRNPEKYTEIGKNAQNLLNEMSGSCDRTIKALQELKLLP